MIVSVLGGAPWISTYFAAMGRTDNYEGDQNDGKKYEIFLHFRFFLVSEKAKKFGRLTRDFTMSMYLPLRLWRFHVKNQIARSFYPKKTNNSFLFLVGIVLKFGSKLGEYCTFGDKGRAMRKCSFPSERDFRIATEFICTHVSVSNSFRQLYLVLLLEIA